MISTLAAIGKQWRDIQNPYRQEAIRFAAPEFCLSPESFTSGLDWMFSFWNEITIAKLIEINRYKNILSAVQVLAGNTPAVIAQAFLQGAILNSPQIFKIPTGQPTFPRLIHESIAAVSVDLAKKFYLDTWENNYPELYTKVAQSDLVVAYGDDKTVATIQSYCAPKSVFLGQGHAVSCAVIFKEKANRESLQKLAWDMLAYDQRGCLSPRVALIEAGGELTPVQCAAIFAKEILPSVAQQLPRGGLFPGEGVAIHQRRAVYGFRGQVYSGTDWTVCYDENPVWPEESLPRFMPFKIFKTINELSAILSPIKNHLISLGVAGDMKMDVADLPMLRHVCALGEMQRQLLFL